MPHLPPFRIYHFPFWPGFCPHCSTGTALTKLTCELLVPKPSGPFLTPVFLDLAAALASFHQFLLFSSCSYYFSSFHSFISSSSSTSSFTLAVKCWDKIRAYIHSPLPILFAPQVISKAPDFSHLHLRPPTSLSSRPHTLNCACCHRYIKLNRSETELYVFPREPVPFLTEWPCYLSGCSGQLTHIVAKSFWLLLVFLPVSFPPGLLSH